MCLPVFYWLSILCYSTISSYIVTPVAVFGSNHSIIACDRSNRAMPAADGVYYGPHFQTCHWCGLKIHSCGANAWEPDQPIPRFILPLSTVVICDPVYYHANCEQRQVDIYTRDGWCDIAIREYFQKDRRPPPVAMGDGGSSSSCSSSQENMDSLEV